MSTHHQTIEHIVLLNVKPDVDATKAAAIIDEINGLASLGLTIHLSVGKLLRSTSTSLNFSHIVHGRFKSTDDLQAYNHHPEHMRVAGILHPIVDDFVVVDWVSNSICDSLTPGYVMCVTLLKLKDGLDENEKSKLVEEVKSLFKTSEQVSIGENFSREMGKGYSIAMSVVFPDLDTLGLDVVSKNLHESKVKEFIDSEVVVDYVAP
ncbi:hypothetical protein QVD17_17410 [Tagetes erecta]|uniref:Stress-response A/B barrel domain-containing protein n=1 Tax=Tagetes erecta TaxID=13708 RepID=A0AAD8KT01_TARER|nr:hypothetical protein QVD17_17410 [Tagetes erecta]